MKTKRLVLIILLIAAVTVSLAAQIQEIFAPFVSRLQGELKNNLVRLSWIDSPDVRGTVYVYRSAEPFEGQTSLSGITPAEIPYGVQSFVDEIESGDSFYYFAAASDETGRRYEIPIIDTNTIRIEAGGDSAVIPAKTPETPPLPRERGIFSLEAAARGGVVEVTFTQTDVENAALYRSIRPISQTSDLLGAVIVATKISSPFSDYPVPGIPYFYAVIPEEDLVRGTVEIVPGRNATLAPAVASAAADGIPGGDMRAMPLPLVSPQSVVSDPNVREAPAPVELSPEAAKALAVIPAGSDSGSDLKKPRVFARDLNASPAGGEDYALGLIVQGAFSAKNWEGARKELSGFLALPRSPEAKTRARFYLGQCCYFLNKPQEGLFEFLAIQDRYPNEAGEWIQASLDMMKK